MFYKIENRIEYFIKIL